MGWILCLSTLIAYIFKGDVSLLYVSGVFAISGGLSTIGAGIGKKYN